MLDFVLLNEEIIASVASSTFCILLPNCPGSTLTVPSGNVVFVSAFGSTLYFLDKPITYSLIAGREKSTSVGQVSRVYQGHRVFHDH